MRSPLGAQEPQPWPDRVHVIAATGVIVGMAVRSDSEAMTGYVGSRRLAWHGPHAWHQDERIWSTTNRQLDVWIELLHTLDLDPAPVLLPTLGVDFEGDHWTHAQVCKSDLWACYGIVVEEMPLWRPLLAHLVEQLERGHVALMDADEYHLPDTDGGSHGREHLRTVIAVTGYDRRRHVLRYMHGATGGEVTGRDLDALLAPSASSGQLLPCVQLVKLDRLAPRSEAERAQVGIALAHFHGTRFPARNPVRAFADSLRVHGGLFAGGDAEHCQRWAFATLHQCGAAFEVGADVCAWLAQHGEPVGNAVSHLRLVARNARSLHQRLVRLPLQSKLPDVAQTLSDMARSWDDAMAVLRPRYAG